MATDYDKAKELQRLQRAAAQGAANDDFRGASNATSMARGQSAAVPQQKADRINAQYAHDGQLRNQRMLQAQQQAANDAQYAAAAQPKKLSYKEKKALAKAHKTIKKYQKSPFVLVYTITILLEVLDILLVGYYILINSFLLLVQSLSGGIKLVLDLGQLAACVGSSGIACAAKLAGKNIVEEIVASAAAFLAKIGAGFAFSFLSGYEISDVITLVTFLLILSFIIRIYPTIFIWRRTSLIGRKILAIGVLILEMMPIINLLPFTTLQILSLQNHMKKEVRKAKKTIEEITKKQTRQAVQRPLARQKPAPLKKAA